MITDRQVRLMRQKRMEGKTQEGKAGTQARQTAWPPPASLEAPEPCVSALRQWQRGPAAAGQRASEPPTRAHLDRADRPGFPHRLARCNIDDSHEIGGAAGPRYALEGHAPKPLPGRDPVDFTLWGGCSIAGGSSAICVQLILATRNGRLRSRLNPPGPGLRWAGNRVAAPGASPQAAFATGRYSTPRYFTHCGRADSR